MAKVDPSIGKAESAPAWQYEHLDINNDPNHTRGNDLWDPAVRKALAMAVDKTDMISVLFPGQSGPAGLLARPARPLVRRRRDLPGL